MDNNLDIIHSGGCHCRQVRFDVRASADLTSEQPLAVRACNCSICERLGYLHWIVPAENFELRTPWDALSLYTFNTDVAQHWFCPHCGVKSFYRPRSHPNGISVNARCLDNVALEDLNIRPFDGRNWERNLSQLAPLPKGN